MEVADSKQVANTSRGVVGWVGRNQPGKRGSWWHYGCCYPKGGIIGTVVMPGNFRTKDAAMGALCQATWPQIKAEVERQGERFG